MPVDDHPTKTRLATSLIGAAGVHYVCLELSLRGLIAMPTIRNAAGIDVLVSTPDGQGTADLQVKTAQRKVRFWPTQRPDAIISSPKVWFVFLRWIPKEGFEGFLVSSRRVKADVQERLDWKRGRGLKDFTSWHLPVSERDRNRLREAWLNWSPGGGPAARVI